MEGVTTALVVYSFLCIARPRLIRNRSQFYAAFALTIIVLLIYGTLMMLGLDSLAVGISSLLQVGAVVLMFLSTGGQNLSELGGHIKGAYEVIRRGEEEKEVIIPPSAYGADNPRKNEAP
jgi:drug/metabolite transporter (DMT)-like permease